MKITLEGSEEELKSILNKQFITNKKETNNIPIQDKYELVRDDNITIREKTLYRIRALKDFYNVRKGDLGGYIQSYDNLDQEGNCWVYSDAGVWENAEIHGDARIMGHARVLNNAKVYDKAVVMSKSIIKDNAIICDGSIVDYYVSGDSYISDFL